MAKKFKELVVNKPAVATALLLDVEERQTKNGGAYCKLTLSDGGDQIVANMWDSQADTLEPFKRSLVSVVVTAGQYQGNPSYTVSTVKEAPATEHIEDYIESAPLKSEDMYEGILSILEKAADKKNPLVQISRELYKQNKMQLFRWSAAKAVHHNCYGGLLYHTYRMMQAAVKLMEVFPVTAEVLLPAVMLHDIGKLEEISTDEIGISDYTEDGNLLGHTLIGIGMVDKMAADLFGNKIDEETLEQLRQLKHAIASHHGKLEWGAISAPATREAMLLHELDMIDSRFYQFEKVEEGITPGTMSDRINTLDGVKVYHPVFVNRPVR